MNREDVFQMKNGFPAQAQQIMNERFGHDSLIALATTDGVLFSQGTRFEIDFTGA